MNGNKVLMEDLGGYYSPYRVSDSVAAEVDTSDYLQVTRETFEHVQENFNKNLLTNVKTGQTTGFDDEQAVQAFTDANATSKYAEFMRTRGG